jgi:hypothetical protein
VEDRNARVTFHCPVELLERIEERMAATQRSKSGVIVYALRSFLPAR